MKAFFDRTAPFFIVTEPSFDAVAVEVPAATVSGVERIAVVLKTMNEAIENASAPEESAQDLADLFTDLLEGNDGAE